MDEILRSGVLDKLPPRHKEPHSHVKREDVELIVSRKFGQTETCPLDRRTNGDQRIQVHELEIPKSQAEKALHEAGGDVSKALKALVTPKKGFGTSEPSQS
jgi:NACalpha-BTF3-like transcription factor